MHSNLLLQFGPNIWTVEQPSSFLGVPLGLRMTIVRLRNQQLLIHSMIPCNEETYTAIDTLGEVRYLISPNLEHTRFIQEWQQHYPKSALYAPTDQCLTKHALAGRTNNLLPFQHNEIQCIAVNGMPRLQEFVFFHAESQTLILTDLAFNLGGTMSLWGKIFLHLNAAYKRFTPTRILKSLIKDRAAFNDSIQAISKWDFTKIIIAHGSPITQDARNTFEKAFAWAL
ncbi:MAG: DUF4336 domain-containing protein [Thiotrichaceae bacterium]|nr:DUF4336 domain-containing protein [Thiotrichaceae bacterium]PCI13934.1 MAG: hypothetical protein COB71_04515 [Thiotrichales bacterium]